MKFFFPLANHIWKMKKLTEILDEIGGIKELLYSDSGAQ